MMTWEIRDLNPSAGCGSASRLVVRDFTSGREIVRYAQIDRRGSWLSSMASTAATILERRLEYIPTRSTYAQPLWLSPPVSPKMG